MSVTQGQIKKREREISLAKERKETKQILPEGSAIYEEESININMVRLPSLSLPQPSLSARLLLGPYELTSVRREDHRL